VDKKWLFFPISLTPRNKSIEQEKKVFGYFYGLFCAGVRSFL